MRLYISYLTVPRCGCAGSVSVGGHLFDAIVFDVDNKDSSLGMSCPPAAFVETPVLQKVFNLLTPRGKRKIIYSCFTVLILQPKSINME